MCKLSRGLLCLLLLAPVAYSQGQGQGQGKGKGKKIKVGPDQGGNGTVDPANPLANGMVMFVTFGECGGTVARNLAPGYNGTNDGVIAGSPTWISTPFGCGIRFSGSDDAQKVTFPLSPWPALNNVRSVAVLFRMNSASGDLNTFLSYGASTDAGTFWNMNYNTSAGQLRLDLRDVSRQFSWAYDQDWHVFTAVYPNQLGNTQVLLYLDGKEVSTTTSTGDRTLATVFIDPGTPGEMMLGRWGLGANSNCHCDLGGAWIWNRPLNPAEVQMHGQGPFSVLSDGTRVIYVPDDSGTPVTTIPTMINNPVRIN